MEDNKNLQESVILNDEDFETRFYAKEAIKLIEKEEN